MYTVYAKHEGTLIPLSKFRSRALALRYAFRNATHNTVVKFTAVC